MSETTEAPIVETTDSIVETTAMPETTKAEGNQMIDEETYVLDEALHIDINRLQYKIVIV